MEYRRILVNIEYALETIQSCLYILDICNKINVQIENGKYYSAMKSLQDLQDNHLKKVASFQFAEQIKAAVPGLMERIQGFVLRDLKSWLTLWVYYFNVAALLIVRIKENSKSIGRQAMRNTVIKQDRLKLKETAHKAEGLSVNAFVIMEIALTEENDS